MRDAQPTRIALAVAVAGLAAWSVARSVLIADDFVGNLVVIGVLALLVWWSGLSAAELGLQRAGLRDGLRWGAVAVGVLAVVLAVAALLHVDAGADDRRVNVAASSMLLQTLVVIPLGTVLLEELAFRGVLLGLLRRLFREWPAAAWASLAFGLWHVAPAISTASDNALTRGWAKQAAGEALLVAGTVATTTIAGLVFAWLRLRSRSLLAPVLAHWAVNSLSFAFAWSVSR